MIYNFNKIMTDMRKIKKLGGIVFIIFVFVCITSVIKHFFKGLQEIIYDLVYLAKMLYEEPLITIFSFGFVILLIYIILSWDKRDDFFYFVVSILSSPSEYIYKRRKKQLLNYHKEIKELIDSIYYFSSIDSKNFSKEDFWKFADDISKQNERLEKNRKSLEKQNNRINIVVQLFILCCGIITSLFI